MSYLQQVNSIDVHHSAAVLSLLVRRIRAHWPEENIVFRGDVGFYRSLLLNWCERNNVRSIIGLGSNAVLLRECHVSIETLDDAWLVQA